MDGDQRMKQHERLMARSGNSTAGGRATDHFEPTMNPRGEPTGMSQAPERAQMSYDYGYTSGSFHGGSLQPHEVPGYPPEFTRSRQGVMQQQPQHQHEHPQQSRRRAPHDPAPPFVPYESAMLYGFGQQGPAQGPFDVVPQYSPRQSAAIEALSNQFAVPQYFTPEESTATGVPALSTYLGAQQMPYNHPGPMARPSTTQPFPATMSDFTPIGTAGSSRLDPPSQHHSDPPQQHASDLSSLEEAYSQYQRALRGTFDSTRTGRLVEASRSLLEISEWLVTNSRDLGRFISFSDFFFWGFASLFGFFVWWVFWVVVFRCELRDSFASFACCMAGIDTPCRTESHSGLDPVSVNRPIYFIL